MIASPAAPTRPRRYRRAPAGLLGILAATGLAACGGAGASPRGSAAARSTATTRAATVRLLDVAKVTRAVEDSIYAQRRLRSTVICPRRVPQRSGGTFTCTVKVGTRLYPVVVSQVDGRGDVRYVVR